MSANSFESTERMAQLWHQTSLRDSTSRPHTKGKGLLTKREIKDLRAKVKSALSEIDTDDLRSCFRKYDLDRRGVLSLQRFKDACESNLSPDHPLCEAVHLLDQHMVTPAEFRRCIGVIATQNEDGFVDYEELLLYVAGVDRAMMSSEQKALTPHERKRERLTVEDVEDVRNALSEACLTVHGHDIREFFAKIDVNGNGTLSYSEFMSAVLKVAPEIVASGKFEMLMTYLDKDGSETIDYEEFLSFVKPAGVRAAQGSHKIKVATPRSSHRRINIESRIRAHLFNRAGRSPTVSLINSDGTPTDGSPGGAAGSGGGGTTSSSSGSSSSIAFTSSNMPAGSVLMTPGAGSSSSSSSSSSSYSGSAAGSPRSPGSSAAGSGYVDERELHKLQRKMQRLLRSAAKSADLHKIFDDYDMNSDGHIDIREFTKICARCCPMTKHEVSTIFNQLDTTGEGIDFASFAAFAGFSFAA
eukprot:g5552.t1